MLAFLALKKVFPRGALLLVPWTLFMPIVVVYLGMHRPIDASIGWIYIVVIFAAARWTAREPVAGRRRGEGGRRHDPMSPCSMELRQILFVYFQILVKDGTRYIHVVHHGVEAERLQCQIPAPLHACVHHHLDELDFPPAQLGNHSG